MCEYLYEKAHVIMLMCVGGGLCTVWCVCVHVTVYVWPCVCLCLHVCTCPGHSPWMNENRSHTAVNLRLWDERMPGRVLVSKRENLGLIHNFITE